MVQSLSIQCYFSVICEISTTYVQVSKEHIMPGINLIDELSLERDQPYNMRVRRLETWGTDSRSKIENVASTVRLTPV